MIVQPSFGQRVKQRRRQLGLAQANVAGKEMSASYISLVESGRRTPSDELALIIAQRLGTDLGELTANPEPDPAARPGRRMSLASRLIAAGSVRSGGDLESARTLTETLVADIASPDDDDLSWEARWLLAEILLQQHDLTAYDAALEQVRTHPFTAGSPELRTRVAAAGAERARRSGRLEICIAIAETALTGAQALPATAPERLQLQTTLLAALVMVEETRPAQTLADQLSEVLPEVTGRLLHSGLLWTVAAARSLAGATDEAAEMIERALTEVSAAADLARWAALCRSAAAIQLNASADPGPARAHLRRSRQAFELIGTPIDLAELAGLDALAHLAAGEPEAAVRWIDTVPDELGESSPARRAGVLVTVARVRAGTRGREQALAAYRQAAGLYEESGAYKSALRVWRELNAVVETGELTEQTAAGWLAVTLPS